MPGGDPGRQRHALAGLALAAGFGRNVGGHDQHREARFPSPAQQVVAHREISGGIQLEPSHAVGPRSHDRDVCRVDGAGHIRNAASGRGVGQCPVRAGPDQPGESHRRDSQRHRVAHTEEFDPGVGLQPTPQKARRHHHSLQGVDVAAKENFVALPAVEVLQAKRGMRAALGGAGPRHSGTSSAAPSRVTACSMGEGPGPTGLDRWWSDRAGGFSSSMAPTRRRTARASATTPARPRPPGRWEHRARCSRGRRLQGCRR